MLSIVFLDNFTYMKILNKVKLSLFYYIKKFILLYRKDVIENMLIIKISFTAGPGEPLGPGAPAGPGWPWLPTGPISPVSPSPPLSPFSPCGPELP